MKKTLTHLPEEKRRDLRQLVEIIREEIRTCEMIILYGSYARGTYVDYDQRIEYGIPTYFMSDYDILIVTENGLGVHENWLYHRVKKRFFQNKNWRFHTNPEFINVGIRELNRQLGGGQYFYTDIKGEGVMLWNSGRYKLARRRNLKMEEIRKYAQEYFDAKFSDANEFLHLAADSYNRRNYKMASFNLHQAAENLLRVVTLVYTLYSYKDHKLEELIGCCKMHTLEVCVVFPRDTPEEERLFGLLEAAYIQARSNKDFVVTQEDIDALVPRIERLRDIVEKVCRERLESYGAGKKADA